MGRKRGGGGRIVSVRETAGFRVLGRGPRQPCATEPPLPLRRLPGQPCLHTCYFEQLQGVRDLASHTFLVSKRDSYIVWDTTVFFGQCSQRASTPTVQTQRAVHRHMYAART